jgi:hypothetical protein
MFVILAPLLSTLSADLFRNEKRGKKERQDRMDRKRKGR